MQATFLLFHYMVQLTEDLHSSGENSFYSNIMRLSEFYNLSDFDPSCIFLTDAKIKHYVNLMQQKYILYCQHIYTIHLSPKWQPFYYYFISM